MRPHQALGHLTPLQFLQQSASQRKKMKSVNNLLNEYKAFNFGINNQLSHLHY